MEGPAPLPDAFPSSAALRGGRRDPRGPVPPPAAGGGWGVAATPPSATASPESPGSGSRLIRKRRAPSGARAATWRQHLLNPPHRGRTILSSSLGGCRAAISFPPPCCQSDAASQGNSHRPSAIGWYR